MTGSPSGCSVVVEKVAMNGRSWHCLISMRTYQELTLYLLFVGLKRSDMTNHRELTEGVSLRGGVLGPLDVS